MFESLKRKMNTPTFIGFIAISFAALLWSIDALFLRAELYKIPAEIVVFWEHFLGFIILSPFLVFGFKKLKYLKKKDWFSIIWISIVGSLVGTIFITKAFFGAFELGLSISIIVILQKLQPLSALLLARTFLKEKLKKIFYFWALISIIAAFFLAFGISGLHFTSKEFLTNPVFYAIIAAFAFGSSTVFGKHLLNHIDFKTTTALRFGFASIFVFLYLNIFSTAHSITSINLQEWKYLLIIVFSTGTIALFIYYFGLKKVTASIATLTELFFPLFTIILEYFFFGKFLSLSQIIFAIIFLFSIYKATKTGNSKYQFSSHWIHGKGRGTKMGLRTINLADTDLEISFGVYLVEVIIENKKYKGLMHYGPILTFNENVGTEIYLKENIKSVEKKPISVSVIKKLRKIRKFNTTESLVKQINKDIRMLD